MNTTNETTQQPDDQLVVTHTVNVPRTLVYKVWTEEEHLNKWWGAAGAQVQTHKLDLRPGGVFHYSMQTPDGNTVWGKFAYREIIAPERIVFTTSFADQHGESIRNPWAQGWPMEVLNTLTFTETDGKTVIRMEGRPVNATDEETRLFLQMRPMVEQGFTGTFAKLDEYLKEVSK